MFCKHCGKEVNNEWIFCKHCGGKVLAATEEYIPVGDIPQDNFKKKTFWQKYILSNIDEATAQSHIKNAVIAGAISFAITALVVVFRVSAFADVGWLDLVILVVLVFGVYKKSIVAAVCLFVYFLLSKLIQISEGEVSAWQIFIGLVFLNYYFLGILGTIKYHRIHKEVSSGTKKLITGIVLGAVVVVVVLAIVGLMAPDETVLTQENNGVSSLSPQDIVSQADYNEGYKAGYADGRTLEGRIGDSYLEPATVERRGAYSLGYLEGFAKGCQEGNFDCTEVENTLSEIYRNAGQQDSGTGVELIPSTGTY